MLHPHVMKVPTDSNGSDIKKEIEAAMDTVRHRIHEMGYKDTQVYYLSSIEPTMVRAVVHNGTIKSVYARTDTELPDIECFDLDSWMYEPGRDLSKGEDWLAQKMAADGFGEIGFSHGQIELTR